MCKTIKQKVTIAAAPAAVYSIMANSRKHEALSGEPAKISKKVGGPFSLFSGRISGVIVDLLHGKRIVLAWRSSDFPTGVFSMATFHFSSSKSGGTEVTLIHRGVPKELIPKTEKFWKERYWNKMKELFRRKGL